jgi:hypothetical protein
MSGVRRLHWNIQPAKAHHAAADADREDDPAPAYVQTACQRTGRDRDCPQGSLGSNHEPERVSC